MKKLKKQLSVIGFVFLVLLGSSTLIFAAEDSISSKTATGRNIPRDQSAVQSQSASFELNADERAELLIRLKAIDFKKIGEAAKIACKNSSDPVECMQALSALMSSVWSAINACGEDGSSFDCLVSIIDVINSCWDVYNACAFLFSDVRSTPSERIRINEGIGELRKLTKELARFSAGLAPPAIS
ncbi:MAG: hypothetical protein ACK5NT_14065 [Pyrinomonadaceae bacterium]